MKRGFLIRGASAEDGQNGDGSASGATGSGGVGHRTVQLVQLEKPKRPSAAEVTHADAHVVVHPPVHTQHAQPQLHAHAHSHGQAHQQSRPHPAPIQAPMPPPSSHAEPLNKTQGRLRQKLSERQGDRKDAPAYPQTAVSGHGTHQHAPPHSHVYNGAAADLPIDLRRVQETKWTQPNLDRGFRPSLPSFERKGSDPSSMAAASADSHAAPKIVAPRPLVLMAPPKMSAVSSTGFRVSWTAPIDTPTPVTLYQLEMDSGSGSFVRQFEGTGLSTEVSGLRPGKTYRVRVLAMCDDSKSQYSQVVSATTLSTAPSVPEPPRLCGRTKNTLSLKWVPPADNGSTVTSYRLEWDEGTDGSTFIPEYQGPMLTHKIVGAQIKSGHKYSFRVAAENAVGWSPLSEVVAYYTSATVPSTPDAPQLVASSIDSLTVRWKAPLDNGSPISEYRVEMSRPDEEYGFRAAYSGDKTEFCAKGLKRNAEYALRVLAINAQGESKCSAVSLFTTRAAVPGAPNQPRTVGVLASDSINVAWDVPKDDGGAEIVSSRLELDRGDGLGFRLEYEGPLQSHRVQSLVPGTPHTLRVQCANESGFGPFSPELKTRTAAVPPGAPEALSASSIKSRPDALAVKWGAPSYNGGAQVSSYILEISEADSAAYRAVYSGPNTVATVEALHPGRSYRLRCVAVNSAGKSTATGDAAARTAASAPAPPPALSVTCTATGAVVSWQAPADNGSPIGEYRIEMTSGTAAVKHFSAGTATTYEVKGLVPASEYRFAVQALSSAGAGPLCTAVGASTLASPPSAPSSLTVTGVSASGASISWTAPRENGAAVTSYRLEVVAVSGDATPHVTEAQGSTAHADVGGLRADEGYRVRVQAANRLGMGPFSSFVSFQTAQLPPGQPSLEEGGVSHNSIKVKWSAPKGVGADADVEYTLEMRATGGKAQQSFVEVYRGPLRQFKATKLRAASQYAFRVRAANPAGEGPWSATAGSATLPEPLPQLPVPRAKGGSITWAPVPATTATAAAAPSKGAAESPRYELQRQRVGVDADFVTVYTGNDTAWPQGSDHAVGQVLYRVRIVVGDACGPYSAVMRGGAAEVPVTSKDGRDKDHDAAGADRKDGKADARKRKAEDSGVDTDDTRSGPATHSDSYSHSHVGHSRVLELVLPLALVCTSLAVSYLQSLVMGV